MLRKILYCALILGSFVYAKTLEEIRNDGVLRVGVWGNQPSFSKAENGTYEGFEVEIAKNIGKYIFGDKPGKIEFVSVTGPERITFLQNDTIDMVVANFTITEERKKLVDFSMSYFSVNLGIVSRVGEDIKTTSDLRGKVIIVESETIGEDWVRKQGFDYIEGNETRHSYELLKAGAGDAYISDNSVVLIYPVLDDSVEVNMKKGVFEDIYNIINVFYKCAVDKQLFLLDNFYSLF